MNWNIGLREQRNELQHMAEGMNWNIGLRKERNEQEYRAEGTAA